MNALQKSLFANAVFSMLSGTILIVFWEATAHMFGVKNSTPFWLIGIGLLLFACFVFFETRQQRPSFILSIILQDVLWVLTSVVLIAWNPFHISVPGIQLIALIALIVLFFAMLQFRALAHSDTASGNENQQLVYERTYHGSKEKLWALIADVAHYHEVAPNIDQVKILSGQGEGMIRRCSHGRNSWTETCSLWEEGEQYSFEVNTQAVDYPYPLKFLKGTWKLVNLPEDQVKVILFFDFAYKSSVYKALLHPMMKIKFNRICWQLFNNWQKNL